MQSPLAEISAALRARKTTSRALTETCLAKIHDPKGEGYRAFTKVYADSAVAAADAVDAAREAGKIQSPLAGIPVSIKDLFDIAGEQTLAGSVVLRGRAPAAADAEIVKRLRLAGAVIVGRTNMTEFACSGIGLNPHFGTPASPWDRASRRIPGGSSSGAAVSVSDGMAACAIGTDTGGSVRIPAALCGIVGFKPTAHRIPREGCFPLAPSFDSVGSLAPTVNCCAIVDSILAGEPVSALDELPLANLRFGVPKQHVLDGLDPEVARAFSNAVTSLSRAGARVVDFDFARLGEMPAMQTPVSLGMMEAYAVHRRMLATAEVQYDPRVSSRILQGRGVSAADYIDLLEKRASFIRDTARTISPFDAIVMPTVALVSPPIATLEHDSAYGKANALALRNACVVNYFDGTALTIPCHEPGNAPVGLMLASEGGSDRRLLAIGQAVERVLPRIRGATQ